MGKVGVIIPAAGQGSRMGADKNKVLLKLSGVPIIIRTLEKFSSCKWVDYIIVVAAKQDINTIEKLVEKWRVKKVISIVVGGDTRQQSVSAGINELPQETEWVFIHDAARPLVSSETLWDAFTQVKEYKAVTVGVPVKDTIKLVEEEKITGTLSRDSLRAMQTPQVFSHMLIKKAYKMAEKNCWESTDDCGLVEKSGVSVHVVNGNYENIKITTPEDMKIAESIITKNQVGKISIGMGYDVHRFIENHPLFLAGIEIDYSWGLAGHSDADVAVHALMDGLLGAASLGDIGHHFPDNDPSYKGISSLVLLGKVLDLLRNENWLINNVDLTIVAQKPKLSPYISAMRFKLATELGVSESQVNIKATTTERLGFTGRGEGVAAYSAVSLVKNS